MCGWDCHGLADRMEDRGGELSRQGAQKTGLFRSAAMIAFRRECRAYAEKWLSVQREEFKRLGVAGEWERPYSTWPSRPRRGSRPKS